MKSPHSGREPSRSGRPSPTSSRRALRKHVLIGSAAVLVGGVPAAVLLTTGGSHRTGSEVAASARLHGQEKPARRQANVRAARYKWANAPINGGGFVTGLVFNPKKKNLAYARTDIGGAYRWNAKTRSWLPLTDWIGESNSNLLGIESLATDPVNPNRLYLAAGTYTRSWAGNGAILRSTDQGARFTTIPLPFKLGGNEDGRSMGERLAIDPNDNRVLYLGTRHDGLWRSADYGSTWRKVASFPVTGGTSSGVGISFVTFGKGRGPGPTKTIYVGVADSGTNLYRSTDGGASWSAVPGQPTGMLPHHGVLASDGQLYLSYGNAPGPNGVTAGAVWRLTTGTGGWRNITPALDNSGYRYGYAGLAVDPRHPKTVMVATLDRWWPHDEIYRSTDQGTSWKAISPRAVYDNSAAPYVGKSIGHWIGAMAIDPFAPDRVIYGTGSGIWGSDDVTNADRGAATHWSVRAKGLEETAVLGLISIPGGAPVISALGDVGGFTHTDLRKEPRTNFTNPTFANTTGIDFAQKATKVVARVGTGNEAKGGYSTDGGRRWTPFRGTPTPAARAGSIAVSADAATFVWTPSDDHTYYSRDRGTTWNSSQGLPANAQVVADRANPRVFYALAGGTLYFSGDAGATFAPRATSLPGGSLKAVSGAQGDLWIAAGDSGLLHSTNGGATFSRLGSVTAARGVGFGKPAPGARYQAIYITGTVGRVSGAFRSVDGGTTWLRITDDRHQFGSLGSAITGDPDTYGRVYLGSNGRGVLYGVPR
ncbi:WD40/YVTN/BNR-like repeat-containing protein [Actinomadura kijaniata]|uniref:WD40/YVTN/BNR-like repeat-containing protein n=1 Tax=Actinomadura kijaniata TaxID=46161 RepID=UPI003F1BDD0F